MLSHQRHLFLPQFLLFEESELQGRFCLASQTPQNIPDSSRFETDTPATQLLGSGDEI